MANTTYFLSQNPVINQFEVAGSANPDSFINDTVSSGLLSIHQEGPNVVISDGVHSATFTNFAVQQLTGASLTSSDGSQILIQTGGGFTALGDYFSGINGADVVNTGGGNDLVYGNLGSDIITVGTGAQTDRVTVYGGKGDDIVKIDNGNVGQIKNGSELIYGDLGSDSLNGGNGNDTIYGGQGGDLIAASSGNDLVRGDKGNDTITGGNGTDTIYGGVAGDTLPDDDTITTGTGTNLVYGATGNDTINIGASGASTAYGGKGDDSVTAAGSTSSELIYGNLGNDTLTGGTVADSIYGGQGNDTIVAGAGNDFLSGDIGNDVLRGDAGADKLSGGAGNNFFDERPGGAAGVPITAAISGITEATADTITDFVSGANKIVTGLADGTVANFQTVKADNTVISADTAEIYYATKAANTYTLITGGTDSTGAATGYLVIDNTANGSGDEIIKLTGDPSVKAADIIKDTAAGFSP